MANRTQRRLEREQWLQEFCSKREQEKREEEERIREKNKIISELRKILSVLSDQEFKVKTRIDCMRREMNTKFNEFLTDRIADCLSNGSDVGDSSFQVPASFFERLSEEKPRLEQISKQISIIKELIQNVSPSVSTALSEFEQQIISIMNVKSFFESQTVESVQRMINVCSSMRECLNILGIYSEEIKKEMRFNIQKQKNLSDFEIDPQPLWSNSDALNKVSQELADFKQKIDEIIKSFLEKYTVEYLFSESADFSPFFEFMRSFDDEIKRETANFSTTKSILVRFVNDEFYFRKDFVDQVCKNDCKKHVGYSGEMHLYEEFYKYYIEPAGATRKSLEAMLRSIS